MSWGCSDPDAIFTALMALKLRRHHDHWQPDRDQPREVSTVPGRAAQLLTPHGE